MHLSKPHRERYINNNQQHKYNRKHYEEQHYAGHSTSSFEEDEDYGMEQVNGKNKIDKGNVNIHTVDTRPSWQNCRKSSAEECILDDMALHIECRFNKNFFSLFACWGYLLPERYLVTNSHVTNENVRDSD